MLRISAAIAMVALIGTAVVGVSPARAQGKPAQRGCYNSQTCVSNCMKDAIGRKCELWCQRQATNQPACK